MNRSAASSSSAVVTPSRTLDSRRRSVWTRITPAAAMRSISCGVFLMITARRGGVSRRCPPARSQLVLEAERRDRRPDVVVHLGGRARAVEAAQEIALVVVLDEWRGLLLVDLEALADRLLAVVVALLERLAVDIADALALGRVELDVVDVAVRALPAAGQAAHDLVGRHLDEQRGGQAAPELGHLLLQRLGLGDVAGEAVEQEAVLAVAVGEAAEDHPDDDLVGHEVAALHVRLRLAPEVGLVGDGLPEHVPGGHVAD